MFPNLVPGDRVFVNKMAYGLQLPLHKGQVFNWSTPQRGDVIVFSFPHDDKIFVKRVIGLPGDLISFHEGNVQINENLLELDEKKKDDQLKILNEASPSIFTKPHSIAMNVSPGATFFESRRFLVPPGKLFVLGDNRDNSDDSRAEGFVDLNLVYGKVKRILLASSKTWPLSTPRERRFLPNAESL